MSKIRPQLVTIDQDAINHLLKFCKENQLHDLLVVSDRNTRRVLGQRVEEALKGAGFDVKSAFFDEDEPVADGEHVMHVLLACDRKPRTFIAIGGGTITDITRVVSHRTRCEFISMPTAPSVDAYASIGAPLIINGVKISIWAHAPIAIIADIDVLCNSPRAMIAAGFGDMIANDPKFADKKRNRPHGADGDHQRPERRKDWQRQRRRSQSIVGATDRIRLHHARLWQLTSGLGDRAPLLAPVGDDTIAGRATWHLTRCQDRFCYHLGCRDV